MIANACGSKLMQGSGRARAILLVSHGSPSAPEAQDGEMAELAEAIAALRPDWRVEAATLAVPGAFEARLDAMPGALIVPLFMASGWFVSTALPKRIGARAAQLLPPLGACEGVATLFAQELRHHLDQRGWVGAETALLLGAHGSQKSPANAIAAQTMGARLQAELGLRRVAVGLIEEPPAIETVGAGLGQAMCLPFFVLAASHVTQDLQAALDRIDFDGPVLPPLIRYRGLPAMIVRAVDAALDGVSEER